MIELINYKDNKIIGTLQIDRNRITDENPAGCFKNLPENIKKVSQNGSVGDISLEEYCLYTARSLGNKLTMRDGDGILIKSVQVNSTVKKKTKMKSLIQTPTQKT